MNPFSTPELMEISQPHIAHPEVRGAIQQAYSDVAERPSREFHLPSGTALADRLLYSKSMLDGIPEGAIIAFSGVGNPFTLGSIKTGEVVLDVGSGAGLDALIAAGMVGPMGRVIGVDVTEAMVAKAWRNAQAMWATNVQFVRGMAESLPIPEASIDVVISNGAIHLCSDKSAVFAEMHRVLKPGGRFQIADILVDTSIPSHLTELLPHWTSHVAGSLPRAACEDLLHTAGFCNVEVVSFFDTFKGTGVEAVTRQYGARGFNIRGYKEGCE